MSTTPRNQPPVSPLQQRAIEIELFATVASILADEVGAEETDRILGLVVDRLAEKGAAVWRERMPDPSLADLWSVWGHLGGEGRLDLHLDELTADTLRFHIERCQYADHYRSTGLEELGVAFSCRRDAPFARALVPGVTVEQSATILEGSPRCEFTYRLEDR